MAEPVRRGDELKTEGSKITKRPGRRKRQKREKTTTQILIGKDIQLRHIKTAGTFKRDH